MRVAYILMDFPKLSEAFVLREIEALRRTGETVDIYSLRNPREPVQHPAADALAVGAVCADSLSVFTVARSVVAVLVRRPLRCFYALGHSMVELVRHPRALLPFWRYLAAAFHFANDMRDRGATQLHAHFAFLPADVGRFLSRILDLPLTVSAHAWDIHVQSAAVLKTRLARARAILVCSEDGRDALRAKGCPARRLHLVRHGLPLDIFDGRRDGRREARLLAVGRMVRKKGLIYLVRACGILRRRGCSVTCRIVGDGPCRSELLAAVAEERLDGIVHLVAPTTGTNLLALYRGSDILAHPSVVTAEGDRDGVPNAILEAMAMRLAVVATPVGGIPEVITHNTNGVLADARSAESLADAIESLMADRQRMDLLIERGRRHVVDNYDARRNAKRFLAVLREAGTRHAGVARE